MGTGNVGLADLVFPALGLGGNALTGEYGPVGRTEISSTVRRALELGVRMIDMAGAHRGADLERIVGKAIRGSRVLIATRGGPRVDAAGGPVGGDGRPGALARACDASLRRLAVDAIDLFYLGIDPRVPVEESVGELGRLVDAGKIRHIGLSHATAEELRRAHAERPVAALALEYSLLERGVEAAELPAARALGVTVIAARPLARGLLTGRISSVDHLHPDDVRRDDPRFRSQRLEHVGHRLLAAQQLAAEKHVSLSRLALAWLLAQPGVVPVPSTRDPLHLEMDAAAVQVRFTTEERDRLETIFPTEPGPGADHRRDDDVTPDR
ncbi:aldo/keto reductase [Micromonospora sp. PLK6-60]|uniref:aldo/keto reductase n=1 Tax=Micromonospora sp. PLK6-60 TaxID=2873383 RepID=UPI001CA63CD7|nr:aldo/keto reductase [Micromonospora sp. PLK6-60]MBY8870796.1 aldo/keto reductase [Micromonospora sp. PLK6-60]